MTPSSIFSKIKDKLSGPPKSTATKVIKGITFNDVRSLHRPAPAWKWILKLPPIPSEGQVKETGPKNPLLKTISKLLSAPPDTRIILCEEFTAAPNVNIGKQDRYYNGRNTSFPGLPSLESCSAVFYESEDYATLDYFLKWQYEVYNPNTRVYGVPAQYGKDIEFIALPLVDQEDLNSPKYMSITYKKAWPSSVKSLSYGGANERIKIQVEFDYLDLEVSVVSGASSDKKVGAGQLMNKLSQWRS